MNKYLLLLPLLFWSVQFIHAQESKEAFDHALIGQALDAIYNFEFEQAEVRIRELKARRPQHPVASLLSAQCLYWKHFPMTLSKEAFRPYQAHLQQTLRGAQALMGNDQTRAEGIFFALTVHGYQSLLESEAGHNVAAMREARKAFGYLKEAFQLKDHYPDLYLATGLYNFYVEQYPEDHPVVKPIMWFFSDGNKKMGLQQLEMAARQGTFIRTEALYHLVCIYQKYGLDPVKAPDFSWQLVGRHPRNLLFVTRHAELLIAGGRYGEAQPFVDGLSRSQNVVFLTAAHCLQGIIQEKQHRNLTEAKTHYQQVGRLSPDKRRDAEQNAALLYTRGFHAMAHAGLERIARQEAPAKPGAPATKNR